MTQGHDGHNDTDLMRKGFDGMSEELAKLVTSTMDMISGPDDSINPMYHIHGVKKGSTTGDVIAVMDDRCLWMPSAMMFNEKFGGAEWAAMIADAHVKVMKVDPGTDPETLRLEPGDLQRARVAGDMEVKDCAIVTLLRDSGLEEQAMVPYSMGDSGEIVWESPKWVTSTDETRTSGFVSSCLQVLMGHRHPTMDELVEVMQVVNQMRMEEAVIPGRDN